MSIPQESEFRIGRNYYSVIYEKCGTKFATEFIKASRKFKRDLDRIVEWKDVSVPQEDSKIDFLLEYRNILHNEYVQVIRIAESYTEEEFLDELKKIMGKIKYIMSYLEIETEIWLHAETISMHDAPVLSRCEA